MIMDGIVAFFTVFVLRLGDVPIGTLRTMLMIQGRRSAVFGLAVLESLIWMMALSWVMTGDMLKDPWRMGGYAFGFATGVIVGMTVERWVAIGTLLVRIISREHSENIRKALFDGNFGTTVVDGRGHEGPVLILFVVCPRRRLNDVLRLVEAIDPNAVVTHDAVTPALGGYHGAKNRVMDETK